MEGIVLFNKPKNYTSYQVVEFFKKRTEKKVGHGGTLDPLAEGLLILGIGEYTKELNKFLKESIKTYIAEIVLGARSTTYDREGKIYPNDELINYPNIDRIKEVINSFIGEIEQIPPPFSAVKIKGKPAYLLARKGEKVELKPRKVKIYEIKILNYNWPILKIEVTSSSGTYIRSLANDIGEKLGCGGYLNDLKRIKIVYPNDRPNKLPESSDRLASTRITRPNNNIYPNNNRIEYPNEELNKIKFGNNSGNLFGQNSGSKNIFGQNSGKVFGEYSGNVFTIEQALTFEDIENDFLEFYAKVYGRVQGVGYRYFVKEKAQILDLFGYVKNLEDGTVEVLAQGREENLQKLIEELKKGPYLAKVEKIDIIFRKPLEIFRNFEIKK
jgi:tRNA pseudouridine55 synthase